MSETPPAIRRVLMTGDTVGGVWTFALQLARGLAAEGIEVVLAAMGGTPSATQMEEASGIPNLCVLGSAFKLEWMDEPWADVEESGHWLMELEHGYRPDIVHLNSFGHGALPWSAPTILTAHSCVLSWWQAVKGETAPASWDRYRTAVARSLQSVDGVTAPSRAMAESLRRNYGDVDCKVISNGLPGARFRANSKEPFIFTAGRLWDEGKNVEAVARVAKDIAWPVYIAGDSRDLALPGCRALGRLSSEGIAGWYARASIYALPARYEPFGLSVLEAALSGCALVLGDIPSLREIWGDAALFVRPDDHEELRRALESLIRDEALRKSLAGRSQRRALMYDDRRMAQSYLTAYSNAFSNAIRSRQCVS